VIGKLAARRVFRPTMMGFGAHPIAQIAARSSGVLITIAAAGKRWKHVIRRADLVTKDTTSSKKPLEDVSN